MAKTKEASPPPSLKVASPPSARFMVAYRVVKVVAIVLGFPATMISIMAAIGAVFDNGWVRVIGALVFALGFPLGLGDRLLPADDPKRAKGIITEVMAVTWVVIGFGFATAANAGMRPLLVGEADRLQKAGYESVAAVAYFLAGVNATPPAPEAKPDPSASASASASASSSSSAAPATTLAGAAPSASASTSASAAPSAGPKAPEKTPAELFKALAPSVVTIFVKGASGDGGGTGFLLDKAGTIVTNHHVIDEAKQVKIKLFGGASYTDVELLVDDANVDLALLKVDPAKPSDGAAPDFPAVTLGDSDGIQVGERAVSIGNPLGLEHTLTDGLVSARRMYEGRAWIQMSVPVSPGNSGGPLFNMQGEVIGITTAQIGGMFGRAQNLNLAVPVNELKKLIRADYPGKRKFGDASSKAQW